MSKIQKAFKKGRALMPFIVAGDPDLETTERLIAAMADGGADLIVVAVPFSDPVAEGPEAAGAHLRALAGGVDTDGVFDMLERVRRVSAAPVVLWTYANPVFVYGVETFMARAEAAGVDGVILPDVPYEEREEIAPLCEKHGIDLVPLIAPAPKERIQKLARSGRGLLCCLPAVDAAGPRPGILSEPGAMIAAARAASSLPCALFFDGPGAPSDCPAEGVIFAAAARIVAEKGRNAVQFAVEYLKMMNKAFLS